MSLWKGSALEQPILFGLTCSDGMAGQDAQTATSLLGQYSDILPPAPSPVSGPVPV